MQVRSAPTLLAVMAMGLALAGCTSRQPALPRDCLSTASRVAGALRRAPAPVTLAGGTKLSTCVARSDDESELQDVGSAYTGAATTLGERVPRSDAAALQLGYLVGATRRGAARTNGIAAELVRRLEQQVGVSGPPRARRAAYARGMAAGARVG